MENEDNYVKILFRYYSRVLEEETVETMWATVENAANGLYKIDNIPFYGPLVAPDDIVFAEYDEYEQMLTYRHVVEYSGNSVVQVLITQKEIEVSDIRKIFEDLGCESEGISDKYFAMEIPSSIDYAVIKKKLNELESDEKIEYAEPCLSEKHQSD